MDRRGHVSKVLGARLLQEERLVGGEDGGERLRVLEVRRNSMQMK
jgi:hypothetical protein